MQTPKRKPPQYAGKPSDPLITKDKFVELQNELEKLKRKLPTARAEVARLADLGDFSENAGYQFAKGRLRGMNNRIADLQAQIDNAQVIEKPKSNQTVEIGHHVTVDDGQTKKTYQILGGTQTNPGQGVISHTSPLGSVLLGAGVGDKVKLKTASGEKEYQILKIE